MISKKIDTFNLINEIEGALPIHAYPTKKLIHRLREGSVKIKSGHPMQIINVIYLGDSGGIGCEIKWKENQASPLIASLTHLRIDAKHPLSTKIRGYQKQRIDHLSNNG